jgi:type I restriction enzyme S subunit
VKESATSVIPAGNIIVPTRMALGKVAINRVDLAINQDLKALLIRDRKRVDGDYLFRFLLSKSAYIEGQGKGATVKGITVDVLRKIEVPLPSLSEQKRIAAILDKADAIRRKRQQAIQLADEFLRSVFLEMFGDPITNPKKWVGRSIGEVCRVIRGSSPRPKGDPRYYGGSVPRLLVEDLTRDGWFVTPRVDSLTEEGARLSRPVPKGTLVMVVSGNVGVMARLNVDACIHDGFAALIDIDKRTALPDYLMCVLTFLKETHAKREAGAIFKNLTTDQIREMVIPTPPTSEQARFVDIFAKQRALRSQMGEIAERDDLFGSLSQRAFRGEL